MSQKTNPTSLRLQKVSQNFGFPLFADFFWSDTYQSCLESQNYITSFFKETSFSNAFFSAKMFYRKFPVFIFIQDNRVTKKEKLLFFKNSLYRNIERKSRISKKDKTIDKDYNIDYRLHNLLSSGKSPLVINTKETQLSLQSELSSEYKDLGSMVINDFLKVRQGFFKKISNSVGISTKKSIIDFQPAEASQQEKKLMFHGKTNKTEMFWQKKSISEFPKIFTRPCFSYCENVMSLSYKQRKNLPIYNTLFETSSLIPSVTQSKRSQPKTKKLSVESIASGARTKLNSLASQDQQNHHHFLISDDILNKMKAIQKENIGYFVNNCSIKAPFFKTSITFEPIRFVCDYQNVTSLIDQVVALLEKRISFRQIKSLLFKDLLYYPQIKGIRISCSGRLGGRSKKAQKAKVQSDSCGATTLAAFSSNILFASKSASTSYGKVGVKIWLSFTDIKPVH